MLNKLSIYLSICVSIYLSIYILFSIPQAFPYMYFPSRPFFTLSILYPTVLHTLPFLSLAFPYPTSPLTYPSRSSANTYPALRILATHPYTPYPATIKDTLALQELWKLS